MKKIFLLFLILPALACTMSNQARGAMPTPSQEPTIITVNKLPEIAADAPLSPTATATACEVDTGIEGGTVNLRTCAGISCSVLAIVTEGESLDILTAGNWIQVTNTDGVTGWLNSKYCKGK